MANDTEGSPFEFTGDIVSITLPNTWNGVGKKPKLAADAGVYQAARSIPRMQPQKPDEKILRMKNPDIFLTLDALKDRLEDAALREKDYDAIKAGEEQTPPKAVLPFELWDKDGTFASLPPRLIPTNKPYDDAAQLQRWLDVARHLGGKPPTKINPPYARFALKPSDKLKNTIKLYITPANPPVFGVDVARLEAIINANQAKFDDWPQREVIGYTAAEGMSLKLIGRNFLQFYFAWMKVDDYKELWKEFQVTELLHSFPTEGDEPPPIYETIDKRLKKSDRVINGQEIMVTWKKIEAASGKREGTTATIMGESATKVVTDLWGDDCITTGMGNSKAEWLHRAACAFGGLNEQVSLTTSNDVNNLVFGTWECNTDMIRVENMVTTLTKKDDAMPDSGYKGKLTTINNIAAGSISRVGLEQATTSAIIPKWVETKNYSWLCFSLDYRYRMKAAESPLPEDFATKITFDPWSLYVPLAIEPRLDIMIVNGLRVGSTTAHSVTKRSIPAYAALAWNAALKGLPSLELPNIVIHHPTIAQPPDDALADESTADDRISRSKRSIVPDAPVPLGGFVLLGDIRIFSTSIVGHLEKWMGPAPDDVIVGTDPPSIERVVVKGDFQLSTLIPLLQGTLFDNIIFRNVVFYHQNYAFDKTKSIGWHFNADWVIDSSCGLLYNILTQALQVTQPVLSIHAFFGERQGWNVQLSIHSFILEGVFPDLALSPVTGLTLTSIGVRLLGIRGFSFDPEPHSTLSFGFDIFGTMMLTVPGSVVPLNLVYELGLVESTVNLSAEISGRIWEDALGVKDLLLEDVVFTTSFSATSPWNSFALDVSATFSYMSSQAYLEGSYASGGQFAFTAELDNFGTDEISDVFFELFSNTLTLPDFDVHIGSATLSIASGEGLSISLRDVTVAGHTAASIQMAMSSLGVSLSGAVSSSSIIFGDVQLDNAVLKLSLWSSARGKNVDVMLGGKLSVDFLDVTLEAAVHLYPGPGGVEWAIVAELNAPDQPFALSNVVRELKDAFLDFSLKNAVFIAASKDDPLVSQLFPGYHVRQGVQVFGVIDRIPALNSLLREEVTDLVLDAGWSKASSFHLGVALPAESTLDLGNGIKTTPITLRIRTDPVELAISAGVKVPVKDSTPLDFNFELAGNAIEARASAQMVGWWDEPFGINNLKIGPEVMLSIEIIYEQFIATGTPSGFGVAGGFKIGNVEASLKMNVSEDPTRQMLSGKVENLDISDVVTFAGTLVGEDIPKIPDGSLTFEELQLYICPSGVVVGQTTYPPGFSFKAHLLFFGKKADIECTIDKVERSVDIIGGVDNFELGPLTVRGLKGPRAELECHIGVSRQQLAIDGVVTIFELEAETDINVQFLPDPIFKYHSLVEFADVFMFKLDAELVGSIRDPLSDADFSLRAELENDILHYLEQQVIEQLEGVKVAVTEDLETAQKKVDEAETSWKAAIATAEKDLEEKREKWKSHEDSIRSSNQPVIDDFQSEISRLEGEIDKARQAYDDVVRKAERKLEEANEKRGTGLADAERALENTKRDVDNKIDEAQRGLDSAEADLSIAFGNAQRVINAAQRAVTSLENQINDTEAIIDDYIRAPWYEFWKKGAIASLQVFVRGLVILKFSANTALDAARSILLGMEYLSKEAAVKLARESLEGAREAGKGSMSAVEEALRLADETSKVLVDDAIRALDEVRKGSEFIAFQGAEAALEEFKNLKEAAYKIATEAIEGLKKSAEFIAFDAAEVELEVAKGSTEVLDAAKETLSAVGGATEETLSALQKFAKYAERALDIQSIILSGTLRGILGTDGGSAQPLSAVIKGIVVGESFEISATFDPRESAAFVKAIFKQLWDRIVQHFSLAEPPEGDSDSRTSAPGAAPARRRRSADDDDPTDIGYSGLEGAKSTFLEHEPAVLKMLIDESDLVSPLIPRGPFSNTPVLPSVAVARRILALMQEENGASIFHDVGEF